MKVEIINEATDMGERFEVLDIKRERESVCIVTPSLSIFIGPIDEFIEAAIDLLEA